MGQELRLLGCPCRVCLAGLARSRSTNISDAVVLVKNKDSRVRVLGLILPPLSTGCVALGRLLTPSLGLSFLVCSMGPVAVPTSWDCGERLRS